MLRNLLILVVGVALLGWVVAYAAGKGLFGETGHAGEPRAKAVSPEIVAFKQDATRSAAEDVGVARPKQILFGDLHVHTTFSTDAFLWSLPTAQLGLCIKRLVIAQVAHAMMNIRTAKIRAPKLVAGSINLRIEALPGVMILSC